MALRSGLCLVAGAGKIHQHGDFIIWSDPENGAKTKGAAFR